MKDKGAKWKDLIYKLKQQEISSWGMTPMVELDGKNQCSILAVSQLTAENFKDTEKKLYNLDTSVKDIVISLNKYIGNISGHLIQIENDIINNRLILYEEIGDILNKNSKLELEISSNREEINNLKRDVEFLKKQNDIIMADYMLNMMTV